MMLVDDVAVLNVYRVTEKISEVVAVEVPFVAACRRFGEKGNGDLLTHQETLDSILSIVHARGIPS